MPLYAYWCPGCKVTYEQVHGMAEDRSKRPCAHCGSKLDPRIMQSAAWSRFTPYIEYNCGDVPLMIESAKQLDREAEARGLAVTGTFPGKKRFVQDNQHRGIFPRVRNKE